MAITTYRIFIKDDQPRALPLGRNEQVEKCVRIAVPVDHLPHSGEIEFLLTEEFINHSHALLSAIVPVSQEEIANIAATLAGTKGIEDEK